MIAIRALTLALTISMANAQQWPTLSQELGKHGVPHAQIDDAEKEITSYAVANDARWFGIAYYWFQADGMLPRQLRVRTFDKRAHRWRFAELDAEALRAGSALRIARARRWIYIDTHLSPSAGSLVVLTENLRIKKRLYGWTELIMPDGRVVYHNSMVHFAPMHPGSLSLYDPVTNHTTRVYPSTQDEILGLRSIDRSIYFVTQLSNSSIAFSVEEQDVVLEPHGAKPIGPLREFRLVCDIGHTQPRCVRRSEGP